MQKAVMANMGKNIDGTQASSGLNIDGTRRKGAEFKLKTLDLRFEKLGFEVERHVSTQNL